MSPDEIRLQALREAVRLAPEDPMLRSLLGEQLLASGDVAGAEEHFRAALRADPENRTVQLGLAKAFHAGGKRSAALVVLEEVVGQPGAPAGAHLLHARLLLAGGDTRAAAEAYRRAREEDPRASDPELDARLALRERAPLPTEPHPESDPAPEPEPGSGYGAVQEEEKPSVTFADIGGMEAVKDEIRLKIIHPLRHPELYRAYGKAAGGGILLYGPPGCGKTHIARATAGEIQGAFLSVGISDVLDMWFGESERHLHEIFRKAREMAPCVLFFDEVDALAASRADLRTSAGRHIINQFLSELDGLAASNEGVLVLAATNAPWHLDPAFRRPGRFDRILFVPPPDAPARAAILELLLRGKPRGEMDVGAVVKQTEGFSGADLRDAVDRAVEGKLREALRSGVPGPLTTRDLLEAVKQMKPSTREWLDTARNYVLYADRSGLYEAVRKYLRM
jgi:transitional endoplasmic reticulum ATPase